jgi:mRNA-degrading endonuclease RelE of RelBE toxin-antitoxin system
MNYAIVSTEDFDREVRSLVKKYRSLPDDLEEFKKELLKNPNMGDKLSANTRKVRMAIASKNKGKRGGARVITCTVLVTVDDSDIYLLSIYDKGERDSITGKEIETLKEKNGLI